MIFGSKKPLRMFGKGFLGCFCMDFSHALRCAVYAVVDVATDCYFHYLCMLTKCWSVYFVMETSENPVQNPRKKRSESEKTGRIKYLIELAKRIDGKLDSLDRRVSRIETYRKHDLDWVRSDIEEVCADEVDREIVRLLFEAGDLGLLPSVVAERLVGFGVTRFHVARRIGRMNKRFRLRLDECLFEQRGWRWALSRFAVGAWGERCEKAKVEVTASPEEEAWQ